MDPSDPTLTIVKATRSEAAARARVWAVKVGREEPSPGRYHGQAEGHSPKLPGL